MTGGPGMENVNTSCQRHDRGTTDRHLGHLRYVRHPLYLAEAIGSIGAVTLFLAEWAALLLAGADRLPAAADASELGQVADSITP
jgi:hypothetical protein